MGQSELVTTNTPSTGCLQEIQVALARAQNCRQNPAFNSLSLAYGEDLITISFIVVGKIDKD